MNASRWIMGIALVVVVSLVGGAIGGKLAGGQGQQEPEYEYGTAMLEGSEAHPAAHGHATFEAKVKNNERIFKLQLEDAPELARATLNVLIDGTKVGNLKIDGKGNGSLSVKAKGTQPFPAVHDGSLVEVKEANGTLVASGTF